MTERIAATVATQAELRAKFQAAWDWARARIADGHRLSFEVKKATRSTEQNAKFHALCDDVAKSGAKWAGKTRTAAEWKVLFVSGHGVATKEGSDIVPGLESEFVNLRESTARMSVARSSSLIEYVIAWCALNDVRLPTYKREMEPA